MKCRNCRRKIEDNSIFCNWCGAKQLREEAEISVPRPRQLKSGAFTAQLMVDGERCRVTQPTEAAYYAEARAVKAGLIKARDQPHRYLLGEIIDRYIQQNENVLSPSTIRGYTYIRKGRFQPYVEHYIDAIPWQQMINDEAGKCSPKTLQNSWALVAASLRATGQDVPDVNLPLVPRRELNWLDYNQIQVLLDAVRGRDVELPVLLALHSLRLSELLALERDDIDTAIHVRKALVYDRYNCQVMKDTTKTVSSSRDIPVFITRLFDVLHDGKLVTMHPNSLHKAINSVCAKSGLPLVGVHGLRRSFASLGYHLQMSERSIMALGGWSNIQTIHRVYIKLSQQDINNEVKKLQDFYGITHESL